MLIPNTGWNGLIIEKPSSFHSQNADVGFGLFSTNYSNCISFPERVLAVDEKFVLAFGLQDSCALTDLDLPQLFFFPIMLVWVVICLYWLWQIFVSPRLNSTLFSIVPLIYLLVYSVLGGGIDRYGSSVYPVVVVLVFLQISSSWQDSRLQKFNPAREVKGRNTI
jgi:hypothetical protein